MIEAFGKKLPPISGAMKEAKQKVAEVQQRIEKLQADVRASTERVGELQSRLATLSERRDELGQALVLEDPETEHAGELRVALEAVVVERQAIEDAISAEEQEAKDRDTVLRQARGPMLQQAQNEARQAEARYFDNVLVKRRDELQSAIRDSAFEFWCLRFMANTPDCRNYSFDDFLDVSVVDDAFATANAIASQVREQI